MKILWIFFWGHHKIELYLVVISMPLRSFLKINVQNRGNFLVCQNFKYIFGVLEIPYIFLGVSGVNGRCWAGAYALRKNESTPPLGIYPFVIERSFYGYSGENSPKSLQNLSFCF